MRQLFANEERRLAGLQRPQLVRARAAAVRALFELHLRARPACGDCLLPGSRKQVASAASLGRVDLRLELLRLRDEHHATGEKSQQPSARTPCSSDLFDLRNHLSLYSKEFL